MLHVLWAISALILLALLGYEFIRHRGEFAASTVLRTIMIVGGIMLLALIIASFVLDRPQIESKGSASLPWTMIALMYASMLLGIIAQSYYFSPPTLQQSAPSWVKPALASPIIFIPLVSSYEGSFSNMNQLTLSHLIILLVSFQNGFFWKVVFDKQGELLTRASAAAT